MGLLEKDKRKFNVIIGSKKCGACSGASPSLAAKKVKGKSGAFYLKETTKVSKKKLYGPYSSKKRVVQRGGTLKEDIIRDVLKILNNCDDLSVFTNELNITYKILENTYLFLGISPRKDKCKILKELLGLRNIYSIGNQNFPLYFCLSEKNEKEHNLIEFGFYTERSSLILSKVGAVGSKIYYQNNWLKFINFLRITILQIEIEILKKNKKTNIKLKDLQREFNKETEEAKALYAQAGPAEELTSNNHVNSGIKKNLPRYALTNEELGEFNSSSVAANQPINLSQIPRNMLNPVSRRRNLNPIQPSHNNQNNMLTLQERLAAALRNNNNQKPNQQLTLQERLAAIRND